MEQKLEAYRRKRNFLKTSEPSGKEEKPVGVKKRKIFAVQLHYARTTHFDFRLEWDGVLLSWAVPKGPSFNPKDKRLAVRVEEHPLDYADFEGVIPKGEYGGGTVLLWDKGYWTETEDFARGLEKGSLKLRLDGKRLKGGWALVRLNDKDKAEDEKENWLLFKEKDSFAKDTSGLTGRERSVKSGLSAKGIAEKAAVAAAEIPFDCAPVMLCRQVAAPPSEKGWVYEIKYDGYRIAAYSQKDGVRLLTRNGKDFSDKLPELAQAIGRLSNGRALVLDGEAIISDDEGRSDFQALQNHLRLKDGRKPVYMVFDLLSLDGKDLRELPLEERKKKAENADWRRQRRNPIFRPRRGQRGGVLCRSPKAWLGGNCRQTRRLPLFGQPQRRLDKNQMLQPTGICNRRLHSHRKKVRRSERASFGILRGRQLCIRGTCGNRLRRGGGAETARNFPSA